MARSRAGYFGSVRNFNGLGCWTNMLSLNVLQVSHHRGSSSRSYDVAWGERRYRTALSCLLCHPMQQRRGAASVARCFASQRDPKAARKLQKPARKLYECCTNAALKLHEAARKLHTAACPSGLTAQPLRVTISNEDMKDSV